MSDKQATLWASVLRAKKAVVAGAAVIAAFIGATLAANGGHDLTWKQWVAAAVAYLVGHVAVYQAENAPKLPDPVVVPEVFRAVAVDPPAVSVTNPYASQAVTANALSSALAAAASAKRSAEQAAAAALPATVIADPNPYPIPVPPDPEPVSADLLAATFPDDAAGAHAAA